MSCSILGFGMGLAPLPSLLVFVGGFFLGIRIFAWSFDCGRRSDELMREVRRQHAGHAGHFAERRW